MPSETRREIERSMELFAAIPENNIDRAIDELLRREEHFRSEHPMDQGLQMASGVRTMMLLAAQARFVPGQNETPAETTRRQQAMKEALSPERVMNNMLAICVNMGRGAITPIEGVPEIYGDLANSRMRVNLPGNDGLSVEGFFTAASVVPVDVGAIFDDTLDKYVAGHPEWKKLIAGIYGDDKMDNDLLSNILSHQSGTRASVADLQVLDYVCGNVDRHVKNMFYKMDTTDPLHPKCVGVQGIDNDFSFCAHANGKSMADIMNMKIIRKETAEAQAKAEKAPEKKNEQPVRIAPKKSDGLKA